MTKWVSYLLMILIAVQSVLAVADIHQIHQSDQGHLEFSSDDKLPATKIDEAFSTSVELTQTPANALDCQHCCHCHGSHVNLLSNIYSQISFYHKNPYLAALRVAAPSSQSSSLYRPPRG
jgi:hypothetical protein